MSHFATLSTACLILLYSAAASAQLGLSDPSWIEGSEADEHMGWAVASGDFNNDGFDDVAIGSPDYPFEVTGELLDSVGRVNILFGSPNGFIVDTVQPGHLGVYFEGYRLGAALAAGDFNGDDFDDLAIGIPGAAIFTPGNAGEVVVIYGGANNMNLAAQQHFNQTDLLGDGEAEAGDQFGFSLAAGDLTGDGVDDLAIGVIGEDVHAAGFGDQEDAGAVHVLYGVAGIGLTTHGSHYLHEETPGVTLNANAGELFGFALAIGQFMGDSVHDLAVGIPFEYTGGGIQGGAVEIFQGSAIDGIDVTVEELVFDQETEDVLGTHGEDNEFGAALVAADFDGDTYTDLAIGVPGEDELGTTESGAVQILYGGPLSLVTFGNQFFTEGLMDLQVNAFDRFGESLTAADFDLDGRDDLAVGAPYDNSLGVVNAGEATVLYGTANGLQIADFQVVDMIFFGSLDAGDEFAFAMAAGKFGTRGNQLAVGIPNREVDGNTEAGALLVIGSQVLFADGFESADTIAWDAVSP